MLAVSAEPVKAITSWPVTLSVSSRAAPHRMPRAPAGSTPASITSLTICWASHAVAVAGLASTGTPESSATAAFSHRPHDGKLKALMWMATPRRGTDRCMAWNASSLASRSKRPSLMNLAAPRLSPSRAKYLMVPMPPSMSIAASTLVLPELDWAISK